MKTLRKSTTNKQIFGVCGGIGEYLTIDPTVIRILFVVAMVLYGSGFFLYLILALVIPDGQPTNHSSHGPKDVTPED